MLRDKTLTVLGAGMMGSALARGLVDAGVMPGTNLRLFDTHEAKAIVLADLLGQGALVADSAASAIAQADLILIAVKPPMVADVLAEIAPSLSPNQLVISIAAGIRVAKMEALLPGGTPLIRTMPNTPCLIGKGATAISRGTYATEEHLRLAQTLFASVGISVEVPERLLDAVTGLSGSGPAYVYLMIEALADGGVKEGLTRDTARLLAAQTVMGAAQMVLSSDQHPAQLKDNVTTPGGTTIAALHVLERAGIRTALIDAIQAAAERSRELS
ncbi:MAG: pyrroline-5-carboxylate reductase [Janthinobacterium lividum]